MNIALIADDKKKGLMLSFCIAYKWILEQHSLYATGDTGSVIVESTGLKVHIFSPGKLGEQQIAARVAYNEMDIVIQFHETYGIQTYESEKSSLLNLCDSNNIPFATNIATAEVLIKGLERGDLAWRDLINPAR